MKRKTTKNTEEPTAAPPAPEPRHVAVLGDDGTLMGYTDVMEPIAGKHIEVPCGCDLAPGKYRYNSAKGCFEPVINKGPDSLAAIAVGFATVHAAGITLPQITLDWIAHVERYVQGRKN